MQVDPLSACTAFVGIVTCALTLPACNPTTGRILPICRSNCSAIDFNIADCTEPFRNDPDFPALNEFLDTFECFDPQSYYPFPAQYIETDPNECIAIR